jgi:hypothetical protein
MVQIKAMEEIDEDKMRGLFKKRGHGILTYGFLDYVKNVLDGKRQGLEVHQCNCGELMVLSEARVKKLKKKYHTENVPCKVCQGNEAEVLNLQFLRRFQDITVFLDERSVFVTRSEQTLNSEDVETLGKMALGLFPTSTHAEMLVGYYDFMEVLFRHFPKIRHKILPTVRKLFDDARRVNKREFERLYSSFSNWEKSHKAYMNVYSKQDLLSILNSKDSLKSLKDDLVENEKTDIAKAKIQLELSTYQDTIEIEIYLDLLANLLNIVNGKRILEDPFAVASLPPLKSGRHPRKVCGLADKVDYLQRNLPFKIKPMYNTHLRNAVAHNEFEIRVQEKMILLTKYSETFTFNSFHRIFDALTNLHHSMNSYLADYHIAKTRLKVRNQGVAAAILGFTDSFEEEGKLHPKAPCDPQLNIYQYWDFATFDKDTRLFPRFEMTLDEKEKSLIVNFGENGALYIFPEAPELVEWIEQLVLADRIRVVLYTIAPTLPFFAQKAIMRCAVGKIMDVYVINVDDKIMHILPQLRSSALKFLNY